MTILKKSIITICAAVVITGTLFNLVSAEEPPMTDAQIRQIKASCISAKNTMAQLHASDALLRVNRGQIYESMTTKLMSRFNDRVNSNHLDSKDLSAVTQNYNTVLASFRGDYQAYEVSLAAALKIDCTKEPVTFYDAVADARRKRTQVHVDVIRLHQYIDDYKITFDSFVTDFLKTTGSNG